MGIICGKPTLAAPPEGFTAAKGSTSTDTSEAAPFSKKSRKEKKKGKSVSWAPDTKGGGQVGKAANKQKTPSTGKGQGNDAVGANVSSKFIFPYTDGSFSIGARP